MAIDGSQCGVLRLNAGLLFREQDKLILVVGIHVLDDVALVLNQRVRLCSSIVGGGHPSDYSKAADVIDVQNVHAVEGEVLVHPIFAVRVTGQIHHYERPPALPPGLG